MDEGVGFAVGVEGDVAVGFVPDGYEAGGDAPEAEAVVPDGGGGGVFAVAAEGGDDECAVVFAAGVGGGEGGAEAFAPDAHDGGAEGFAAVGFVGVAGAFAGEVCAEGEVLAGALQVDPGGGEAAVAAVGGGAAGVAGVSGFGGGEEAVAGGELPLPLGAEAVFAGVGRAAVPAVLVIRQESGFAAAAFVGDAEGGADGVVVVGVVVPVGFTVGVGFAADAPVAGEVDVAGEAGVVGDALGFLGFGQDPGATGVADGALAWGVVDVVVAGVVGVEFGLPAAAAADFVELALQGGAGFRGRSVLRRVW